MRRGAGGGGGGREMSGRRSFPLTGHPVIKLCVKLCVFSSKKMLPIKMMFLFVKGSQEESSIDFSVEFRHVYP